MAITKKARAHMEEVYARYTSDESISEFDVIHLHDTGKCCINDNSGYNDARHFNLIAYNTERKLKRDLGQHDAISTSACKVQNVLIFIDGSTLIKFNHMVSIEWISQNQEFKPAN